MRLFVHIGSHKTGTTAIQHFAAAHRDELNNQGLLYPSFERLGRRPGRSHLSLIGGIQGSTGPNTPSRAESLSFLRMSREEASAGGKDILLSAESIFRLRAPARGRVFDVLLDAFPDFEIVPVVALRRQDNLADSLYRNSVRSEVDLSREPATWPSFLVDRVRFFDYANIVQETQLAFGTRPVVLAYAGKLRRSTVPAFFERLGVVVEEPHEPERRVNVSYDYLDCHVKRHLADTGGTHRLFRLLERFVGAYPVRSRYSFFSETFRQEFLSEYEVGNARLMSDFPELENALAAHVPADFSVPGDREAAEAVGQRWADYTAYVAERGFDGQLPRHSHRRDCVASFRTRQAAEEATVSSSAWMASAGSSTALSS